MPFSDLADMADMVPFWAEKHIFRLSRQKGKSNMDSFWMILGFLGHLNYFWKFQKISKFSTQNSVKIQVTLAVFLGQLGHFLKGC